MTHQHPSGGATPDPQRVDYAVPARLPRPDDDAAPPAPGWGRRARRRAQAACAALAVALTAVVVAPLLRAPQTGADSPEAAVEALLQGIADQDAPAIVRVVARDETREPALAQRAYDELSGRVMREGEVPPPEVTAVLERAERALGGVLDLDALGALASVDTELRDLRLRAEVPDRGRARVVVEDGVLDVRVTGPDVGYRMPVAEGWERDSQQVEPMLTTVELDGRWYVSLEATAEDLLGPRR